MVVRNNALQNNAGHISLYLVRRITLSLHQHTIKPKSRKHLCAYIVQIYNIIRHDTITIVSLVHLIKQCTAFVLAGPHQ